MSSKTINYELTKPDQTDFYDINVSGVIQNKTGNAEIFLFVDEKGKIIDVGAWWKTLG